MINISQIKINKMSLHAVVEKFSVIIIINNSGYKNLKYLSIKIYHILYIKNKNKIIV